MKEFIMTIIGLIVIAGLCFAFIEGGTDTVNTQSTRIGTNMIGEMTTVGK
jgi:phosphate/sulfate permease